ncbi:MAG: dUTP diphosphatase [Patescibacteria group bacterium]
MKIKIKRIDKSLPLPVYETQGSVGLDLLAREDTLIKSKKIGLIPCNIIVEVPEGYVFLITSRSSTPRKKGLLMPHGIGVLDQDYCGPEDEALAQFYNFSDQDVVIKRGEKVAQGLLMPISKIFWEEVEEINKESRGGLGSTG